MKEKILLENIIGNKEVVEILKRNITMFLWYDHKEEKNPFDLYFSHTFLLFGESGSGKAKLIEASINYAQDLAEKAGKSLKINVFDLQKSYKDNFSRIIDQNEEKSVCHINVVYDMDIPLSIDQQGKRSIESTKTLSEFKALTGKNRKNAITIMGCTNTDETQIEPSVRKRCLCLKIEPDYSLK